MMTKRFQEFAKRMAYVNNGLDRIRSQGYLSEGDVDGIMDNLANMTFEIEFDIVPSHYRPFLKYSIEETKKVIPTIEIVEFIAGRLDQIDLGGRR